MSQKLDILAVVMARAGSVGLRNKALRGLCGRAVIEWTFEHVRESRLITRSVVSSDSGEILGVAREAGFEVIERPVELATDGAATDPVLRHAVREIFKTTEGTARQGRNQNEPQTDRTDQTDFFKTRLSDLSDLSVAKKLPFAVVMLYGNVPVRGGRMIDRCIEMLLETGADSVQTVAGVGKFHPYWMFDREADGRIKKHVANDVFRRQDLPALYSPTGAVYVMKTSVLMAAEGADDPHAFLGVDRRGLIVNPEDSVDIDTEKDLYIAEAMMRVKDADSR